MPLLTTRSARASSVQILCPFILAVPAPAIGLTAGELQHAAHSFSEITSAIIPPPVITPPAALDYIAFQPNAFQIDYPGSLNAFQGMNRFVQINFTGVADFMSGIQTYQRGDVIVLQVRVVDPTAFPVLLFNPVSVMVNIKNPDNTFRVNLGGLVNIGILGYFEYVFQSDVADQAGVYGVQFQVQNVNNVSVKPYQVGFVLI